MRTGRSRCGYRIRTRTSRVKRRVITLTCFHLTRSALPPMRRGEFDEDGGVDHLGDAPYPPSGEVSPAPEVNRVLYAMLGMDEDREEDIRNLVSVHHAMTRLVDDGIGRILDKLEELGVLEETIIVFTADHGDFMAEHNMSVKGGVLYDCLTRVPLIMSFPKGDVPNQGNRGIDGEHS